jgi:hypothetical protein
MPYPDHLERLTHISIDTLGLLESTQAVLKFYGLIDVLDCIAFFYESAHNTEAGQPWSRLFMLMFTEVKPALVAGGYWELVLDAEVWRILREQNYESPPRMIVCWQGKDINLYEILLGSFSVPDELFYQEMRRLNTIGESINSFLVLFRTDHQSWLQIGRDIDGTVARPLYDNDYLFGLVQPRLVELDYWRFVEEHVDDFDAEEERWFNEWHELDGRSDDWEPFEGYELPIHHMLLKWLGSPIRWIARTLRQRRRR